MAKILNLDVIAPIEKRELVLNGTSYEVKGMTVKDFCETTQIAEKLEASKTLPDQIQATIDLIKRGVPSIDEAVLKAMSMLQLRMVMQFVRGEDPASIAKGIEEAGGVVEAGSAEGK